MKSAPPSQPLSAILAEADWHARREVYQTRLQAYLGAHLERTAVGEKHPVYDFLFNYYHYRSSQLLRWHPGLGTLLQGDSAHDYLIHACYEKTADGVTAAPHLWKPQRRLGVAWMLQILEGSASRPPFFGCYGFHEWAMVYQAPEIRHATWPLRFDREALAAIVEAQTICCSHFDAFRFFTPEARPLNRLQPEKKTMPLLEQRGCLHTNMDLYKWAFKLSPFTSSDLVAEAFTLAWEIRETDMRASPYDLRALGFPPIPIETPEGRAEYERRQRDYAVRGTPIRTALIALCRTLLQSWESDPFAPGTTPLSTPL